MKKLYILSLFAIFIMTLSVNGSLNKITPVSASYMKKIDYTPYMTVNGEFENNDNTVISLSYPVCIDEVYVKENQYVNQGQALFSIDIKKMSEIARGNIDEDILNSIDYRDLSKISKGNMKVNITSLPQVIYASSSGYIDEINISDKSVVLADSPLISISEKSSVMAKFSINQQDFGKISVGNKVNISSIAFPDYIYKGTINNKKAVIKKQNSLSGSRVYIDVYADIENPDNRVSDGLQITGKIQNREPVKINALEYKYINQDSGGEYLYILNGSKAEKVYIETGIETEEYMQICNSFPEDTVFLSGNIKEGSRVLISE